MNKVTSIVLLVGAGILLLVFGVGLGVLYQNQQPLSQTEKAVEAVKFLSSKTVPSIVAYGQVTKIDGRNITLFYSGDSITINMDANSQVYLFVNDSTGKPVQKKVEFGEIKVGDNLNITLKLLVDGQLQGQSVFILSPASN
jgi:hypothetical protein